MNLQKAFARNVAFPALNFLGVPKLLSQRSSNRRMILYYHGVTKNAFSRYSGRPFLTATFEKHLRYLKGNFSIVPLAEIFDMYRNDIIPARQTIAITFDDGFLNNYENVFPLLKKYGVPATIFVSACSVEDPDAILFFDLIHSIYQVSMEGLNISGHHFEKHAVYDFFDNAGNLPIQDYIKLLGAFERDALLSHLKKQFRTEMAAGRIDPLMWRLMNADQMKELSDSGLVEIGSHGYSHFNLANIEESIMEDEITRSKKLIESAILKPVITFSFPDGSYNEAVKSACLRAGYRNLCAVRYKDAGDEDDRSVLHRHGPSATTTYSSNIFFIHNAFKHSGF